MFKGACPGKVLGGHTESFMLAFFPTFEAHLWTASMLNRRDFDWGWQLSPLIAMFMVLFLPSLQQEVGVNSLVTSEGSLKLLWGEKERPVLELHFLPSAKKLIAVLAWVLNRGVRLSK